MRTYSLRVTYCLTCKEIHSFVQQKLILCLYLSTTKLCIADKEVNVRYLTN